MKDIDKMKLVIEKEMMALYLWKQFKHREYKKFIKEHAIHSVFIRTKRIENYDVEQKTFSFKKASDETNGLWKLTCNKDILTEYMVDKYVLSTKEYHSFHDFYVNMRIKKEFVLPDEDQVKELIDILQSEFIANIAIYCKDDYDKGFIETLLNFALSLNKETISYYESGKIRDITKQTNHVISEIENRRRL